MGARAPRYAISANSWPALFVPVCRSRVCLRRPMAGLLCRRRWDARVLMSGVSYGKIKDSRLRLRREKTCRSQLPDSGGTTGGHQDDY